MAARLALPICCIGVVVKSRSPEPFHVLAIDCSKGRGIMLPGGKFEQGKDRTYRHAAAREIKEETGVVVDVNEYSLMHHGLSATRRSYMYVYLFTDFDESNMRETAEGKPFWTSPDTLLSQDSVYVPVFDVIFGMKTDIGS